MATVDVTFERGLKIWWSYTWRSIVLVMPVVLLLMLLFPVEPASTGADPGAALRSDPMGESQGGTSLPWLILMPLNIILQVQALRWMLKTRWSDFSLRAVPETSDRPQP